MQKILILVLVMVVFSFGCASPQQKAARERSEQLNQLVESYFESYLKLYPLYATSIGDHRFDDQLTIPISESHRKEELKLTEDVLAKLNEWKCSSFEGQDQLTCDVVTRDLKTNADLLKVGLAQLMPFNQFDSFFADFAELASGSSYITFNNATDYRNFMKRMAKVPAFFDAMIANMKVGMKRGVVTPQILVDRALKQIHALTPKAVHESVFYKPLKNLDKVVSKEDAAAIKKEYEHIITAQIYPAYQKLERFARGTYRPAARKSHGIAAVPGGRDFYLALVRYHTTTDLSPDDIMNLGLAEVNRIRGEFEDVKEQMKFKGTLKQFFDSTRVRNEKLYPFKTSEDVLNGYRALYSKIMEQVPSHFRLLPKAPFEIREVEKFKAENASEAYQNGSPDGTRPGIFWVPIPKPKEYGAKDMESLFLHEAIPGHHFQISIAQELKGMPRYRMFSGNNAYVEGWALYTESLGKELGLYTDPYQWIGRLSGEMHRAVRLVVDTGMHWKGWTREKAIAFSQENEPADVAGITTEIERYMAIPGQALAYKIGEMKIQQLKRAAREALGLRYDDRDFHDEILKDGALPMSVLEEKVQRWIESKKR